MKWLDSITDSMGLNLSKLWEVVENRGVGMLQSMELQRVRHDLATEQQLYSRKANNPLKIGKELEHTLLQRKHTNS